VSLFRTSFSFRGRIARVPFFAYGLLAGFLMVAGIVGGTIIGGYVLEDEARTITTSAAIGFTIAGLALILGFGYPSPLQFSGYTISEWPGPMQSCCTPSRMAADWSMAFLPHSHHDEHRCLRRSGDLVVQAWAGCRQPVWPCTGQAPVAPAQQKLPVP
jgi:hypothetical protein